MQIGTVMQDENRIRMGALLNLDVLASIAIIIGVLIDFYIQISSHLDFIDVDDIKVQRYAYFMVALAATSMLVLLISCVTNKNRLFIWLGVFYVISAFVSTALSGMYPAARLPFRFIDIYYWVAVMLLAYYSVLSLNTLKIHVAIVVLMLPLLLYGFFQMRYSGTISSDTLLLNPVYYIAYLIPIILLLRSNILKLACILLIFAAIVLSYKRLAIGTFLISILVYFICLSRSSPNADIWRKATIVLGAVIMMGLLAFSFRYLVGAFGLDWSSRMGDIVESGGSGRLDIWQIVVAALLDDPASWLLGHGYESTKILLSTGAHNDIIETIYDFGVLGLIFYLAFVVSIVRIFIKMMKARYRHVAAFGASLVWFVCGSMFSMVINYPYWFLGLAFFWGITIADFENTLHQEHLSELEMASEEHYENEADATYEQV
jgi:O-antigen ligase